MTGPLRSLILAGAVALFAATTFGAEKGPLPVTELKRIEPVDFNREVLPFLSDNCLSCHCQSTAKGGLNLETPELMLKGGETGPSVVPGKAAESLCFQAAIHQDADLAMPPRENKAKAKDLSPGQLALLRLWIDQGARPSPKVERVLQWQDLPAGLGVIFAVAVTPDGQFAACSRANRLFIYHLPSGQCVLNEQAHRDQINAVAFNPEGTLLATAGYREVKLWRHARESRVLSLPKAGARLAVSPDSQWMAAAGEDGTVRLWRWPGEAAPRLLATGSAPVSALAFSPDSSALACAAKESLSLWKTDSGELLARAETPAANAALAWLPESRQLASAGADHVVRLWSDALAALGELSGHTGPVTALAAAGPGRLLSGSADGTARLWEVAQRQTVMQMSHGAPVTAVATRLDGARVATAGEDGVAKLWDGSGKVVSELRGNRYLNEQAEACDRQLQVATATAAVRKGALDAAEKLGPAAEERGKKADETLAGKEKALAPLQAALTLAREEKKAAEQALAGLEAESKSAAEALAVAEKAAEDAEGGASPDPDVLVRAKAAVVTAKTELAQRAGQLKAAMDKIPLAAKMTMDAEATVTLGETARNDAAKAVAQARVEVEQTTAAVAAAKAAIDPAEQTRQRAENDLQSARQVATAAAKPLRAVAFSLDLMTLATAGDDRLVHTWSADSGHAVEVLSGQAAPVSTLAFTVRGELLSAAVDGALIGWDVRPHWTLERTIGTGDGESPMVDRVNALAFSRDGKLLATGGGEPSRGGETKLWDAATGQLTRDFPRLHADAVLSLEFSPDGQYLASASADKLLRVTDLASGKIARSFEGHTHHVLSLAWSLDGRTLASAGADNVVKVWDFTTGDLKKNVEGYDKEVTAVRFAGASQTLLTSSGDSKVRLVTTAGAEVRSWLAGPDFVECAAITADGQTVLAGGQDGILRVWNAADGQALGNFGK